MKTFSRAVDYIAAALMWIAVGCIGIFAAMLLVPKFFGNQPYIVLSGSMEPVIHTGSLVYIGRLDREPDVGDIIVYMAADDLAVVHRVDSIGDGGYVMKGDANEVVDANPVRIENVIGEYVCSIPKLGYVLSFIEGHQLRIGPMSLPAIIPIVVGAVLLFRVLAYLFGILAEDDDEDED